MKAYGTFLLLEPMTVKETNAGIVLPQAGEDRARYGRVVSAGSKVSSTIAPIEEDAVVAFFEENTVPIPSTPGSSVQHRIIAAESVIAVLTEEEACKVRPVVEVAEASLRLRS